jgi:hypothetical protein
MNQSMKDRIAVEKGILRDEYTLAPNKANSPQMFAAMQALAWALDPRCAASPSLAIAAGKIPMDNAAS